jgi:hypothetical protein
MAQHDENNAEEHIANAAKWSSSQRMYSHQGVHRYHVFIRALAGLLKLAHGLSPDEARSEFEREMRFTGDQPHDPSFLEFIENARTAFDRLRMDRHRGLASLGRALAALDRVPNIRSVEAQSIEFVLGRGMTRIIEGPLNNWVHRTLESIKDEKKLHRILLRLFQNSVPRYAQITHGPLEHGKDIVVLVSENGKGVLRMYQLKCGDIKKAGWTAIRNQLEEMFQVPMESMQFSCPVDRRVGILVWNGHADAFVDPVMKGWAEAQKKSLGWEFEFMHLDDLVNYILDHRLVSAFRAAVAEAGVAISSEAA